MRRYTYAVFSILACSVIGSAEVQFQPETTQKLLKEDPFLEEFLRNEEILKTQQKVNQFYDKQAPKRIKDWQKGAENGSPAAQFLYAACLAGGASIAQDEEQASIWLRKSADAGLPWAMAVLGYSYAIGQVVEKNEKEAAKWYTRAADAGCPEASVNLGSMYLHGQGVAKDEKLAIKYFYKAIDANVPQAMSNLGWMYEQGLGVKQDKEEAVQWFQKAAKLGEGYAKERLKDYP